MTKRETLGRRSGRSLVRFLGWLCLAAVNSACGEPSRSALAPSGGGGSNSGGTAPGGTGAASDSGGASSGGASTNGGGGSAEAGGSFNLGGASFGGEPTSSGGTGGQATRTVSYVRDIQPVWDAYCVRCHGLQGPNLAAPDSRANLDATSRFPDCEAAPFVVPGEPEQSFLYYKLTRLSAHPFDPACDRWMPAVWNDQADTPLAEIDPEAVSLIRQWILEGAHAD